MANLVDATSDFQNSVARAILRETKDLIEKAKEEVAANAAEEFHRRVKHIIADVALNVSNYYSIERAGQDILIRVKFTQEQK